MTRLRFAAARGARIQVLAHDMWYGATMFYRNDARALRIHPDDAHLQYGPISSALREFAAGNVNRPEDDTHWRIARDYYIRAAGTGFYTFEERSLFLLLLAEALADEGL